MGGDNNIQVDLFLPRRREWVLRIIQVPQQPKTGDREPVMDSLYEVVDAAGALEYSRKALLRVIAIAQDEFNRLKLDRNPPRWADANTPAVYYEFCNAVAWTRTVDDRWKDQLQPALEHDKILWKQLQRIRTESAAQRFEDARQLARCSLHKFTPPYANAGARVDGGTLIYPVPDKIVNSDKFRLNLRFDSGRHAGAVVEDYWSAVSSFIEKVLDVFYPKK